MEYKVVEVLSKKDLRRFIRFPLDLYRDCKQYVPALNADQVKSLTKVSTLSYCKRRMWMVLDGDKVVGRICAMINPRYNALYDKKRIRFGWFDTIDDLAVARLLIGTAEAWAKEEGMTEIHGPLYYNTFGKQGMLIEGFENVPPFNCLYNYPYYNTLLEQLGFEKECDWVQYMMPADKGVPEKAVRISKLLMERYKLREGSIEDLKKDPAMVRKFFEVYNESFASAVYNYVPLTEEEIDEEAASMVPFLSDKCSSIIFDEEGELVAFGISFPSISRALQRAKGRMFPLGWLYLLLAMRDFTTLDLMVNGAVPKWQNKGVSAVYHCILADKAKLYGSKWGISNPQIESNSAVNIWNSYDHEPFMRRRCYIKTID
ncbi:MAG: hypothetical protein J6Y27_03410 [Bacteroidales bacterium]|nr:hypothetical protein [Bacteroidales bacterium]MBP5389376.1 hypothetical protein [Bacteroidales bacterium]